MKFHLVLFPCIQLTIHVKRSRIGSDSLSGLMKPEFTRFNRNQIAIMINNRRSTRAVSNASCWRNWYRFCRSLLSQCKGGMRDTWGQIPRPLTLRIGLTVFTQARVHCDNKTWQIGLKHFASSIISRHWYDSQRSSLCKRMTYLVCVVYNMDADDLATQAARASAAMILNQIKPG